MHSKITLIDGVKRNKQNPLTFEIPTDEEKEAVKSGDYVKIGFDYNDLDDHTCERMWVLVTEPGKGILNNDPILVPMVCNEPVEFETKHILSIIKLTTRKGVESVVAICNGCNISK